MGRSTNLLQLFGTAIIFVASVNLLTGVYFFTNNNDLDLERDVDITRLQNTIVRRAIPPLYDRPAEENSKACRVRIQNKADWHHEVLESIALRFELPWHQFNCDIRKPIIFDFALFQNTFDNNPRGLHIPGKKSPKFLNETEYWSWKSYFEKNLQFKSFDRLDGTKTKAYFNDLVLYSDDDPKDPYDALIETTCEITKHYVKYIYSWDNFFCLLHENDSKYIGKHPLILGRSCFLTPMWPKDQCNFMAVDLPKFRDLEEDTEKIPASTDISICAIGAHNYTKAAELFSKIPYKENNAYLVISSRQQKQRKLKKILKAAGIDLHRTKIRSELDFERYHRDFLKCDIVLPLIDPIESPKYFDVPVGVRKSSGIVPSLIAYKRPAIMHQDFATIYQDYLTAPIETHSNTMESMVDALTRMLVKVHNEKMAIIVTKER